MINKLFITKKIILKKKCMNNVVSKVLLIIVILLIALFAYKTIKVPSTASAKISTNNINQPSSDQLNEINKTEQIIQKYLLNNPEIIVQAMEVLQQRKKQEMEIKASQYLKEHQTEVNNSTTSPALGNSNGNIVIAAFYDYNCTYCKKGDKFINQLIKLDPDVKVLLKPFPILGDASYFAASIALAVYKTDPTKFKNIHDSLIEMQPITNTAVEKLLTDNNLNPLTILELASQEEIKSILEKNTQLARNLKIQGVPAYIINDRLIPGMMDLGQLQKIITEIRSQNKQ